ncbi:RNA polymerase sigma factor [Spirosoma fluviale]|uniref:RNA polymerase sigma-70 factor, ECF subfamily n=1 Tax=Spirosoma fluviale TaxID=1597977 RepID=A0A286G204_9BACT|nr:RNA polymerase sigma factor [Spirosoma fluviale]SOD89571.1 RNA polymerase sigma-70 factor, ECF subfamily [Spirosoma fluviale]
MSKQLIEQCKQGNTFAQKRLFDQYANRLYRVSLRYIRHEPDAEEVLMNAFLKAFRAIHDFTYRDDPGLEAWLRRIVVNEALQHLRANRHLPVFLTDDAGDQQPALEPLPDMGLDAERIYALIQELPPGYRTVFNLYAIEGYTHREIAQQLHISENTSKSQLSKARALLQTWLLQNGYEAETRRIS